MSSSAPPNILLIQADQMSVFQTPFAGNAVVRAPTLARIAREGVVFDAAYCNFPLCAPSRFSMLTGQLCSRIGAFDNGAELPAATPTVAHYLRALGYHTTLVGKMHFVGPDQLHGYEERLTTDIYPADFSWTADWRRDPSATTAEMRVVTEAGPCRRSIQMDFDEEVAFMAERLLFDLARGKKRRPFFATVSFTHPHDPFVIDRAHWDLYPAEAIDMPRLPRALDPQSRRIRAHFGIDEAGLTEAQIRNARRAYYGSISYVDDKIAALLATLETCGLAEDTVVVVTSDHGEFLGERGLWFKRSFFEESIRVPLAVWAPGRFAPRRVEENVSLLDLLPTFCELAGGPPATAPVESLQGRSLVPALQGGRLSGPDRVLAEILCECVTSPLLMVKEGSRKLVWCETDAPQLYDLASDPDEQRDLAALPAWRETVARLTDVLRETWDPGALGADIVASQRQRKFIVEASNKGRPAAWDYAPPVDAADLYYRGTLAFDPARLVRVALEAAVLERRDEAVRHEGRALGRGDREAADYLARHPDIANAVVRQVHEARGFLW